MQEKQLYLNGLKDSESMPQDRPVMHLRLDSIIISAVIILLLLAASFSLGIERGKRLAVASTNKDSLEAFEDSFFETQPKLQEISQAKSEERLSADENIILVTEDKAPSFQTEKEPDEKQYRIQVASFKKKTAAEIETLQLQNNGYQAYHYKSGTYNVVYVEGSSIKEDAEKILTVLKQKYKDCLLRRL